MRHSVPVGDELFPLGLQVGQRGNVHDPQPLALADREPRLDLIEPCTLPGRDMHDNPPRRRQPWLDLLSGMRSCVLADEMDALDGRGNLRVSMGEEGQEFPLPFARLALAVDLPGRGVERGQQMQCSGAPIFVLHLMRAFRCSRPRGMAARPRLQGGLLLRARHEFVVASGPRVQIHEGRHTRTAFYVPRGGRRKPQVGAPGLQLLVRQEAADRLGGEGFDHTRVCEWSGQCETIPWGEEPAQLIRSLAGHLDQRSRHRGGKTPAGDHDQACQTARPGAG
jgi:hypothetical protein